MRILAAAMLMLLVVSSASAQVAYTVMMPVAPAPVVAYYPSATYVAPAYVAPVPVRVPPRYLAASPVIVAAPAPAPVVVAPASPYPPVAAYYGPRVVVHPKVYVAGQPVRNVLRAITP